MHWVSLRDEVQTALAGQWKAFARRHERLAETIDPTRLTDQATASLGRNPAFRKASRAAKAPLTAQSLAKLVSRFVGRWLNMLT